jgi:hypothetical protein
MGQRLPGSRPGCDCSDPAGSGRADDRSASGSDGLARSGRPPDGGRDRPRVEAARRDLVQGPMVRRLSVGGWREMDSNHRYRIRNNPWQRSAWASSMRVRNTGSAVASAQPIVSPARISWEKSSASGAIMTGVFTRPLALSSHRAMGGAQRGPARLGRTGRLRSPQPATPRREKVETRGAPSGHLICAAEKSPSSAKRI